MLWKINFQKISLGRTTKNTKPFNKWVHLQVFTTLLEMANTVRMYSFNIKLLINHLNQ